MSTILGLGPKNAGNQEVWVIGWESTGSAGPMNEKPIAILTGNGTAESIAVRNSIYWVYVAATPRAIWHVDDPGVWHLVLLLGMVMCCLSVTAIRVPTLIGQLNG